MPSTVPSNPIRGATLLMAWNTRRYRRSPSRLDRPRPSRLVQSPTSVYPNALLKPETLRLPDNRIPHRSWSLLHSLVVRLQHISVNRRTNGRGMTRLRRRASRRSSESESTIKEQKPSGIIKPAAGRDAFDQADFGPTGRFGGCLGRGDFSGGVVVSKARRNRNRARGSWRVLAVVGSLAPGDRTWGCAAQKDPCMQPRAASANKGVLGQGEREWSKNDRK